jgi:hypothetical protein
MTSTRTVLYDPAGLIEAGLPFDRAPYEALVTAVLAWKTPNLAPCDYHQIALQLTGHARAVAAAVQRRAAQLAQNNGRRALAEVVLGEAEQQLSAPMEKTAACVQDRAHLVRSLYARLDRLTEPSPAPPR